MSDTEIMSAPPANAFICTTDGVSRWRAEIDGVTVRQVLNGVLISVRNGDTTISLTVEPVQARHLAEILIAASGLPQQQGPP